MTAPGGAYAAFRPELHPRDSHGRFRNKWGVSASARKLIDGIISKFRPMTGRSDDEMQSKLDVHAPKKRTPKQKAALGKFTSNGFAPVQADLRSGKTNSDATEMDSMMEPLPEDMLLTRVMGADAFGLPPERIAEVEEWTGKLVADKGFSPANVGTPMAVGGPHVTMSIMTPKGTPAVIPGGSREVILDRDQPLRIVKVDSDGRGGVYVYAVAQPKGARTRALGRPMRASEKAPAIDATPEELAKRGIQEPSPAVAGVPKAPESPAALPGGANGSGAPEGTPEAPAAASPKIEHPDEPAAPSPDAQAAERDSKTADREAKVADREAKVAEREAQIAGVKAAKAAPAKKGAKKAAPNAVEQANLDVGEDAQNAQQVQRWKDAIGESPELPRLHQTMLDMTAEQLRKKEITRDEAVSQLNDLARDRSAPEDDFLRKVATIISVGPEGKKVRAPRKAAAKKAPAKAPAKRAGEIKDLRAAAAERFPEKKAAAPAVKKAAPAKKAAPVKKAAPAPIQKVVAPPAKPAPPPTPEEKERRLKQTIADRTPLGHAGAEMAELLNKNTSNADIAKRLREYASDENLKDVNPEQRAQVKHELELVAEAFEADNAKLGRYRMSIHLKHNNIQLPHQTKIGKAVDFDPRLMESEGDIPEGAQVEVIRPAVIYSPAMGGRPHPNDPEPTVLKKALVKATAKKPRKAAAPAPKKGMTDVEKGILERADKIKGTPEKGSFEELIQQQAAEIRAAHAPAKTDTAALRKEAAAKEAEDALKRQLVRKRLAEKIANDKAIGDVMADMAELENGGELDDKVIAKRMRAVVAKPGIDPELRQDIEHAAGRLEKGQQGGRMDVLAALGRRNVKMTGVDKDGAPQVAPFDPDVHQGAGLKPGEMVRVVRPGAQDEEGRQLFKAKVARAPAKKAASPRAADVEVDFFDPALLDHPHAQDILDALGHGDSPQNIIDAYVEDGFSPEIAKQLVDDTIKAAKVQGRMPKLRKAVPAPVKKAVKAAKKAAPGAKQFAPGEEVRDIPRHVEVGDTLVVELPRKLIQERPPRWSPRKSKHVVVARIEKHPGPNGGIRFYDKDGEVIDDRANNAKVRFIKAGGDKPAVLDDKARRVEAVTKLRRVGVDPPPDAPLDVVERAAKVAEGPDHMKAAVEASRIIHEWMRPPLKPGDPDGPKKPITLDERREQRAAARLEQQKIANAHAVADALAEMNELDRKKAGPAVMGQHVRAVAMGPLVDEVKDPAEKLRLQELLFEAADELEAGHKAVAIAHLAEGLMARDGKLREHRKQIVDFDPLKHEWVGDEEPPTGAAVEVIRPGAERNGVELFKAKVGQIKTVPPSQIPKAPGPWRALKAPGAAPPAPNPNVIQREFKDMRVPELERLADQRHLHLPEGAPKEDLIAAIQAHDDLIKAGKKPDVFERTELEGMDEEDLFKLADQRGVEGGDIGNAIQDLIGQPRDLGEMLGRKWRRRDVAAMGFHDLVRIAEEHKITFDKNNIDRTELENLIIGYPRIPPARVPRSDRLHELGLNQLRNLADAMEVKYKWDDNREQLVDRLANKGIVAPNAPIEMMNAKQLRLVGDGAGIRIPKGLDAEAIRELLRNPPVTSYHADLSPRLKKMIEAIAGGIKKRNRLAGGAMGMTSKVELTDGREAVEKVHKSVFGKSARSQADAEQLASTLGQALGAPVPDVYRSDGKTIFMDWVVGNVAGAAGREKQAKALEHPDAEKIALLDYLTGNPDRHTGNWMITPAGRPVAIDNGLAWSLGFEVGSDFVPPRDENGKLLGRSAKGDFHALMTDYKGNLFEELPFVSKSEMRKLREKMESLRPQFVMLDRELWLDTSLERMDAVIKAAMKE